MSDCTGTDDDTSTENDPAAAFGRLMARLDYPMAVVTAAAGDEVAGCLVGFTTQCSIDPPRYLVLLSVANRTFRVAERADALGVHVLSRADRGLAALFGEESGDWRQKFDEVAWRRGPGGAPVLEDVAHRFVGRVLDRIPAGDHVAFLLDPIAVEPGPGLDQLGFQDVRDLDAGHDA